MSLGRWLLWGASAFVVAGTLCSLSLPGPFWWLVPALLLLGYQALVVWGVLDLRLNMFAQSTCSIATKQRIFCLTFDDGPDPVSTPVVLDALQQARVQATFFVIGHKVERYPELVRRIASEGHTLAIHSYKHELWYSFLSPRFVQQDILRCKQLIEGCGVPCSSFFRPPVGQASPRTAEGIRRARVRTIGWNVRGGDGVRRRSSEDCMQRVLSRIGPGSIVLLHDAWQGRSLEDEPGALSLSPAERLMLAPAGARTLPRLLGALQERGYRCLPLETLLRADRA